MTPRERTLAVVARERPDRLPRELKLTPPLLESFHRQHNGGDPADYFSLEVRDVFFAPPTALPDFSAYYPEGVPRLWNPPGWEVGEWGVGVKEGSMHHFVHIEHPMKRLSKLEELERYPFPDLTPPERHQHLAGRGPRASRPRPVRHRLHGMDDLRDRLAHARHGGVVQRHGLQPAVRRVPARPDHRDSLFPGQALRRGGRRHAEDRRRHGHADRHVHQSADVPRSGSSPGMRR